MRKILLALAMLWIALLAAAGAAGGDRAPTALNVRGRLSVRVPSGWHVLHGWLSDVVLPAPVLAVASFPAKLSHHSCACGFPNVLNFPRNGAFVYVWEYPHPSRRALARTPSRPVHFSVPARGRVRNTCYGPTDGFVFKEAGRVFQLEIYLGPKRDPALSNQMAAVLQSLRVAPQA